MIIGITINNLLRDHIPQVKRAYQELTGLEPIEPINPFDMEKSFPTIQSTKVATEFVVNEEGNELPEMVLNEDNEEGFDVHELMYKDAAFEIFGRCEELTPGLIHMLKSIEKKCGVEFVLLNK
jgi:hypothetical protein